MRTPLLLLTPLALAACVTVYPPDEPSGDGGPAYARIGQTAVVGGLRVTPLAVLEDSRCPQGVQCVWAGRVRLSARIDGAARELTLGQPATLAGGAITLVEVQPLRREGTTLRPADYRFGFRFAN